MEGVMKYSTSLHEVEAAMRHGDIRVGYIRSGDEIIQSMRRYNQMIIDHYAAKGEIPPCTKLGSGTRC